MSTNIGRFEIVSELAKSSSGAVYKANDSEAGRTVALKTIRLNLPPDLARILIQLILQEGDSVKTLNSQNIAQLYGAGEVDSQFCAAMEYVEGNSLANMIARQEGFSIWDLLDISRQVCLALDHADSHGVLHRSLEPAKIMMQWDGTVKVLGYGVSTMVSALPRTGANVPPLFYYMSPEQVKGELMDIRSNIFSWGAILYEMVTDRKPFSGEDIQTVRQKILEETPEPPATINPRMNLAVSRVIMQALSKSPQERYAHGFELLNDMEKAKETTQAQAAKTVQSPSGLITPTKVKPPAADAPKFIVPKPPETDDGYSPLSTPAKTAPAAARPMASAKAAAQAPNQDSTAAGLLNSAGQELKPAPKKAAAAAAGVGGPASQRYAAPAPGTAREIMSSATADPAVEAPKFKIDPMMAGSTGSGKAASFSEIDELPPLKEPVFPAAPEAPAAPVTEIAEHPSPTFSLKPRVMHDDKRPVITRQNARKAVNEIKKVPPRLMVYSISAAAAVILCVILGMVYYIHRENADDDPSASQPTGQRTAAPTQPEPRPAAVQPVVVPEAQAPEAEPEVVVTPRYAPKPRRAAVPARQAVVPGELSVSSTPEGAQVQVDGRADPSWITPYKIPGLAPGQHTVTISRAGYTTDSRTIELASGSKSFVSVHLVALGATLSVTSQPAGAKVYLDGRDTGHVTPAQITADKGSHTILVRKEGYLDETTTADFIAGQTFHFSPALRVLGITDEIKTGGKLKRLFGGDSTAGMGKVAIKTQPKGAQITVNRRMVDKATPVDFMLNPGNYMIDITMSGYKPIHRVITVEKGSKIELNESLESQ
jgi:serine/threonine protein kinase